MKTFDLTVLATCLALLTVAPWRTLESVDPGDGAEAVVSAYVQALNERDIDGILALAHEEVEWLSIAGARVALETRGRLALAESLEAYFEACPSCRSSLEWIEAAGSRVATFERATWTATSGEPREQASLAVYELEGGEIRRVYYYPAEALPPEEDGG